MVGSCETNNRVPLDVHSICGHDKVGSALVSLLFASMHDLERLQMVSTSECLLEWIEQ